jgi:hypothetical protein
MLKRSVTAPVGKTAKRQRTDINRDPMRVTVSHSSRSQSSMILIMGIRRECSLREILAAIGRKMLFRIEDYTRITQVYWQELATSRQLYVQFASMEDMDEFQRLTMKGPKLNELVIHQLGELTEKVTLQFPPDIEMSTRLVPQEIIYPQLYPMKILKTGQMFPPNIYAMSLRVTQLERQYFSIRCGTQHHFIQFMSKIARVSFRLSLQGNNIRGRATDICSILDGNIRTSPRIQAPGASTDNESDRSSQGSVAVPSDVLLLHETVSFNDSP